MWTVEFPQPLREEFEHCARLVYEHNSKERALIEAVKLWLAQHREMSVETDGAINDRAYEMLKPELEREYWGKWIVIAYGQLQGVGDSLEEVDQFASTARDRIIVQVGEGRPKEVEIGWQMAFV